MGLWFLGLLLIPWLARRRNQAVLATLLTGLASLANADEAADTRASEPVVRRWYVGGNVMMARGTVDAGQMDARLTQQGFVTSTQLNGQARFAGMLFGGYRWRYLGIEAGYTDLGRLDTEVSGTTPISEEYLAAISRAHPESGAGPQASLLAYVPLGERLEIFGRLGAFYWRGLETAEGRGEFADAKGRSFDPVFGLGVSLRLKQKWTAELQLNNYRLAGEDINCVGAGLRYRFR